MFCKWCGNTIKTTDKKCSSCGRETPPLSECGGFYDLVHVTPKKEVPPAAPTMTPPPAAPYYTAPEPKEEKGLFPLQYDLFAIIASGVIILLLLLSIILLIKSNNLSRRISDNETSIAALNSTISDLQKEEQEEEQEEDPTDPADPSEPSEPTTPSGNQKPNEETNGGNNEQTNSGNNEQTNGGNSQAPVPEQPEKGWFSGMNTDFAKNNSFRIELVGDDVLVALMGTAEGDMVDMHIVDGDALKEIVSYDEAT